MPHYQLKYPANDHRSIDIYAFEAGSLGGALDVAKKNARGEWAELCEEDRPICFLELVSEDGVWLIGGPNCQSAIQRIDIPNPQPH